MPVISLIATPVFSVIAFLFGRYADRDKRRGEMLKLKIDVASSLDGGATAENVKIAEAILKGTRQFDNPTGLDNEPSYFEFHYYYSQAFLTERAESEFAVANARLAQARQKLAMLLDNEAAASRHKQEEMWDAIRKERMRLIGERQGTMWPAVAIQNATEFTYEHIRDLTRDFNYALKQKS